MIHRLISCLSIVLIATTAVAGEPTKLLDLEKAWSDLNKGEEIAVPTMLKMAANPDATVALLESKLRPLKLSNDDLLKLLVKLDSEDVSVWEAASEELRYFDPRLAVDMKTLMVNVTSRPLRERLVEVLERKSRRLAR